MTLCLSASYSTNKPPTVEVYKETRPGSPHDSISSVICIYFCSNNKPHSSWFWHIRGHHLHPLEVAKLTHRPVPLLELMFVHHQVTWVVDKFCVMVLLQICKDLEYLLQMTFPRQCQMGRHHGHFQADIDSAQFHYPPQYANQ